MISIKKKSLQIYQGFEVCKQSDMGNQKVASRFGPP